MEKMSHRDTDENMENSHKPKGGLRTMPFIIVNESFERVVSYGLTPNMILYLTREYHLNTASGNSILFLWSALSNFLSIFGAFISDSYLGRFRVIAIGSIISLLGTVLLWVTAMVPEAKPPPCNSSDICTNPTASQLVLLLSAFGFMSIGAGCIRPCSMAFGADQLVKNENVINDEGVLASYFNWYYASISVSTIFALTFIVYIQDQLGWQVGFGVPAILMFLSVTFFLVGSSMYVKVKARNNLFAGLAQVLVVALKNKHFSLPQNTSDGYYCHDKDSGLLAPSDRLRFLNKACIIRDEEGLHSNDSVSKPWELCTVDQVEELKSLIRIIPIWSTGIMIFVTISQRITVLQASSMDRHLTSNFEIPAGSFGLFMIVALMIWIPLYDRVVIPVTTKYSGQPRGIAPLHRMGIGLLISCMAMAVGTVVETIRRRIAIEQGLSEDPTGIVGMSAMWLAPQFFIAGLAEALNAVAQIEFYYSYLPKGMSSMAPAVFTLGTASANLVASFIINIVNNVTKSGGKVSWLSTNLNKGHYDYYYGLLTFLSLLNFVYFLVCCRVYGPSEEGRVRALDVSEDLKQGLLSTSTEFTSTSSA